MNRPFGSETLYYIAKILDVRTVAQERLEDGHRGHERIPGARVEACDPIAEGWSPCARPHSHNTQKRVLACQQFRDGAIESRLGSDLIDLDDTGPLPAAERASPVKWPLEER